MGCLNSKPGASEAQSASNSQGASGQITGTRVISGMEVSDVVPAVPTTYIDSLLAAGMSALNLAMRDPKQFLDVIAKAPGPSMFPANREAEMVNACLPPGPYRCAFSSANTEPDLDTEQFLAQVTSAHEGFMRYIPSKAMCAVVEDKARSLNALTPAERKMFDILVWLDQEVKRAAATTGVSLSLPQPPEGGIFPHLYAASRMIEQREMPLLRALSKIHTAPRTPVDPPVSLLDLIRVARCLAQPAYLGDIATASIYLSCVCVRNALAITPEALEQLFNACQTVQDPLSALLGSSSSQQAVLVVAFAEIIQKLYALGEQAESGLLAREQDVAKGVTGLKQLPGFEGCLSNLVKAAQRTYEAHHTGYRQIIRLICAVINIMRKFGVQLSLSVIDAARLCTHTEVDCSAAAEPISRFAAQVRAQDISLLDPLVIIGESLACPLVSMEAYHSNLRSLAVACARAESLTHGMNLLQNPTMFEGEEAARWEISPAGIVYSANDMLLPRGLALSKVLDQLGGTYPRGSGAHSHGGREMRIPQFCQLFPLIIPTFTIPRILFKIAWHTDLGTTFSVAETTTGFPPVQARNITTGKARGVSATSVRGLQATRLPGSATPVYASSAATTTTNASSAAPSSSSAGQESV